MKKKKDDEVKLELLEIMRLRSQQRSREEDEAPNQIS